MHEFWFGNLLNSWFGGIVTHLMTAAGNPPQNPQQPIPAYVAGEILAFLIIIVGALILRARLSVEKPGKFQQMMELILEFTRSLVDDMIGPDGRRHIPLIGTLGVFVIVCNLLGMIPSLETPTASIQVTLGLSVLTFVHYNTQGFRKHGAFGYIRHMSGPMLWMAVIMFPTEIISNMLRMLSLSVRLWANMLVGGILDRVATSLIPVLIPVLIMALHMFESFLQAYIFMILPALYISLAITEEHSEGAV